MKNFNSIKKVNFGQAIGVGEPFALATHQNKHAQNYGKKHPLMDDLTEKQGRAFTEVDDSVEINDEQVKFTDVTKKKKKPKNNKDEIEDEQLPEKNEDDDTEKFVAGGFEWIVEHWLLRKPERKKSYADTAKEVIDQRNRPYESRKNFDYMRNSKIEDIRSERVSDYRNDPNVKQLSQLFSSASGLPTQRNAQILELQ